MQTLYAIRPLLVDEDRGRASFGQADAYHCCTAAYALKRASLFDRQSDGWGDHRVFAGAKEVHFSHIANDAHVREREAALCNDFPF